MDRKRPCICSDRKKKMKTQSVGTERGLAYLCTHATHTTHTHTHTHTHTGGGVGTERDLANLCLSAGRFTQYTEEFILRRERERD
jgi:hypothetical protein